MLSAEHLIVLKAAAAGCVCYLLSFRLSDVLSLRLISRYRSWAAREQLEWNGRLPSTLHALAITFITAYLFLVSSVFAKDKIGDDPFVLRTSPLSTATLGFSLGYFATDLVLLVHYYPAFGGPEMALHHSQAHAYTLALLATECTTPFVNLRFLLDKGGWRQHPAYTANGMALLFSWILGRIVLFVFFFHHVWLHLGEFHLITPLSRWLIYVVPPVLFTLNMVWFNKILRGALKLIFGLTKLLGDAAPGCMKEQKFENYFGRKIAVDASMHIYSFLVVVGRQGDQLLTSEAGEVTRFVFEGKPPEMKKEELAKRFERRADANTDLEAAKEAGNAEDVEKYSKRTVRVTREHNEECKRLLRLMGVPVLDAPSEAEAQCAQLCKDGLVYGISTEDMDSLTFGTPRLIRHLMAPASQKTPAMEFDHALVLSELGLTNDQFIDVCIMCGCDYTSKIAGIGAVRALALIRKHGNIEGVLAALDPAKYQIPDPFPYQEARRLFKEPDVMRGSEIPALKWTPPDTEGLIQFLVTEKTFAEDRIRKAIDRIHAAKGKATQGRLESFFGPSKVVSSTSGAKRKEPPPAAGKKGGGAAKKGKLGGMGGKKK
ncbi:Flap endonuclease 1 [Chlorella vulgaris]